MKYRWMAMGSLLFVTYTAAAASAIRDPVPPRPDARIDTNMTTTATATTTTTMDPMDEFCSEACKAGVGGPECGCPQHPIG